MTSCPSSIGSTQGRQGLFPGGTASAASSAALWSSRFITTGHLLRQRQHRGVLQVPLVEPLGGGAAGELKGEHVRQVELGVEDARGVGPCEALDQLGEGVDIHPSHIRRLQEREFELEGLGYTATRHQAEADPTGGGHTAAAPAPRSGAGLSGPQGTE